MIFISPANNLNTNHIPNLIDCKLQVNNETMKFFTEHRG